jgi:hypothetical protein
MKIAPCSTIIALSFTCLAACTKTDHISAPSLEGKWKLTGYHGTMTSDVVYQRNDTTIEQTEELSSVSTEAGGYNSFTGNSSSSDSIFVNAGITQKVTIYQNGVMVSDTTSKYPVSQRCLDVFSEFEIIGSDSIHCNGPGIPLTAGLVNVGGVQGAVFSISGDTMTITTHIYTLDSTSSTSFGRNYMSNVITLVRQ